MKKRKNVYTFLKTFSNYQETYQKELYLLFGKLSNFNGLDPLPLFGFVRFLSPPHTHTPSTTNLLFECLLKASMRCAVS